LIRVLSDSPRAVAVAEAVDGLAPSLPEDLCLVLGGDGTMLRAIHDHGGEWRYFGVNCGYLGFLMNDMAGEPADVARQLVDLFAAERWFTTSFPRLRARATMVDGTTLDALATNDVYVERMSGQTCHLRVVVDGVEAVSRLVCDGIIAASPLGSTAYSFSAGGPACHPLLRGIQLTAICPHAPRLAPLILPDTAVVHVEILDPERRPARAAVDGVQHGPVASVEVRASGEHVRLGFATGHDFTATLIRKILRV
jgi:NAD+ kinase